MSHDLGTTPIIADLKGRRVLVTGGSAGIGKATALAFDKNGCKVAILGRRKERLDAVVEKMQHGLSVVADLTGGDAEMQRAVQEVIKAFGGLDIIVNSGGVTTEEMSGKTEAAFLSAIKLHVTGNLALIRAAEEELIKNKGAVVNVSSVGAIMPISSPTMTSYGVAKAAQDTLTKNLAFEFATKGVRVNSVLPAAIETEVFEQMAEKQGKPLSELMAHMAGFHAMKRVGQPEEIAAPIVFLASNAASFITGQNLAIDGGCLMGYWMNAQPFNPEG
ncbi:g7631 [Coccomyxa viridis]|uniref:G7631 protein n=1 Tax=Coccomyxa viridis TaxID=1274662 RepID=A0ABP1FYC0_9CHLO